MSVAVRGSGGSVHISVRQHRTAAPQLPVMCNGESQREGYTLLLVQGQC